MRHLLRSLLALAVALIATPAWAIDTLARVA